MDELPFKAFLADYVFEKHTVWLFGRWSTKIKKMVKSFFSNFVVFFMNQIASMIRLNKRILLFLAISLMIIAGISAILRFEKDDGFYGSDETEHVTDLADIVERGVLRAVTDNNSINYFVYRGSPMGFQLELLTHFAAHIGADLELTINNDLYESIDRLSDGDGYDIIARNMVITGSGRKHLTFTEPIGESHQVLVQRKPERWYSMRSSDIEDHLIRSQLDLAGKTVHVSKHSQAVGRLYHLMEEIGDTIHIVVSGKCTEELIELVARGSIDYTVADNKLARLHEVYFAHIDAHTPLGFDQHVAWAVRSGAGDLLATLNEWLREFKSTRQYTAIYERYFDNPRSVFIAKSDFHSRGGGNISVFDDYFKRYAGIVGWDWRLIASLSYQESRFNPLAESWAGAFGIMQIMPETAEFLDFPLDAGVNDHIAAGIRYLRWIDERLSDIIADEQERKKFVLASYNVGIGHVLDARRLAEKYGKDPNIWKGHVDYYILNKSKPKYYQDPVVRHGYARGEEPYHYVTEILERYRHYKNAI